MLRHRWTAYAGLASLLVGAALPLACGSSSSDNPGGDAGVGTGNDGGGGPSQDGSPLGDGQVANDGGSSSNDGQANGGDGSALTCKPVAAACATGADCCSNVCVGSQCQASIATCNPGGDHCAVGTDCCSGACVNGTCSAAQCVSLGQACPSAGNACCTNTCVGGKCAPIGGGTTPDGGAGDGGTTNACETAGNACTGNAECCSGLCTNGTCNLASSYCIQTNDICYDANDCCTGVCASPNANPVSASNPGTCALPPSSGGVNCTGVDGTLCDPSQVGCAAGCCSHLCAPFGPTGVAICQQAQGCHVEGDLCRVNTDCCGGESPDSGILGAGLVVCSTSVNGGTIGVCMTPTGSGGGGNTCVPEGDVCHYNTPPYACSVSSARSDCCGPQTPKFLACRLDPLGVPRCLAYGLEDGGVEGGTSCRQANDTCATAGDCCNGAPCVPNAQGQLTCASTSCIPTTGACTSSADCCSGITCILAPGAQQGTCTALTPPPPPPSDGGTASDGGTTQADSGTGGSNDAGGGLGCSSLGQSCAALGCCTGLTCSNSTCLIAPK